MVKGPARAAISSLSPSIRPIICYPLLEEEERERVLGDVEFVIGKLEELQLVKHDFIRQALIDGLRQFHFRLERLKWLGWGYTLAGLRDVITAYLALEREFPDPQANTSAAAVLKHTDGLFSTIWEVTGAAADAKGRFDLVLLAFQAAKAGGTVIAGLLASSG